MNEPDGAEMRSDAQAAPTTEVVDAVMQAVNEVLEAESVAQMVDDIGRSKELNRRLQRAFGEVRRAVSRQHDMIGSLQKRLREALMDVELLKRAASSNGQVGVLGRRRMQKELLLELFPPTGDHRDLDVRVNRESLAPQQVDCASRLHLCKAACCRIFNVPLSAAEVESDRYEWNTAEPYSLAKTRTGCVYLESGGCGCTIRDSRPRTCTNYSCATDKRIWQDFDNMVLEPSLAERLATLDVRTPTAEPERIVPAVEPRPKPAKQPAPAPAAAASEPRGAAAPVAAAPVAAAPGAATPENAEPPVHKGPPDFSELRSRLVEAPRIRFVPPTAHGEAGKEANA